MTVVQALRPALLLLLLLVPISPAAAADARKTAVLRGLDKVTARVTTFEAPIDQTVAFGTLRIVARTCSKRPPEETPEVSVFLEIVDLRPGETKAIPVFTGWMFASSPALAAMEHPVYDVWVIDCRTASTESSSPPQ